MPVPDTDCDVLVCGLGPVGQLLANLLGARGVRTLAIDAAPDPYGLPRAAVLDDEVLRILQAVGLAGRVLADAQVQRRVSFVTADGRALEVVRTERGALGHPPLVSIHQPALERALLEGLAGHASVEVRRGCALEAVDPGAGHVRAWVRAAPAGPRTPVRARWLVACDGARSTVRERLGIAFGGSTFAQAWLVVDALCDRPLARVPHPHFVGDPARPVVTLPMSPGRHRWEWMLRPGEDHAAAADPARVAALIAPWLAGERVEVERALVYTYHARHAARWRTGRVLLAGDAAHVMPPFAGQGLASGARDAVNLAWKLAAVLGGAPDALVDSYETERRPHVAATARLAVRWGGVVQTTDPRVARLRDRVLSGLDRVGGVGERLRPLPTCARGAFAVRPARLPWRRGVGSLFPQPRVGGRPLDDLLGAGWSALARDGAGREALARTGVRVLEADDDEGVVGAWLDRRGADWVLLRPDRYVFACGAAVEAGLAGAALERLRGGRP